MSPAIAGANSLRLRGPLATDSAHEIVGSGRGCNFGPPLQFETNAMTMADGRVIRVAFTIPASPTSGGTYDATLPPQQYAYTPLTVDVAASATTGAGTSITATSGSVTVTFADANQGLFYGTMDAGFADGTRVSGVWFCRVGA
jgi:hypothetical protein